MDQIDKQAALIRLVSRFRDETELTFADITEQARLCGIGRTTLQRAIVAAGIDMRRRRAEARWTRPGAKR